MVALPVFLKREVVAQYLSMVEGNRTGQINFAKQLRGFSIVGSLGLALRGRDEYRRNRMMARVSMRIGVGVKLLGEIDRQRSFFRRLADSRALDALAVIDKASRQRPTSGADFFVR